MPDRFTESLASLRKYRLPGLDLGNELIQPNYRGRSILNLPASICGWLGAPGLGGPALNHRITESLGGEYQTVILILMDALSLRVFMKLLNAGLLPVWNALTQQGVFAPLTSIAPSTTAAALTSMWTGRSAAEHGVVGYEMWLKEYGMVINSILHSPMSFHGAAGSLEKAGFNPQTFVAPPFLGDHLSAHGIQVHAFQHKSISGSGLSSMLLREVDRQPFQTLSDLWVNTRMLIEKKPGQRKFVWIYWGEVDYLSHNYGPEDERVVSEMTRFSEALDALLVSRLSPEARRSTLLVLIADHGQIGIQPDPHLDLDNHPNLTRRLRIMPTGENRCASLFIRPGQSEAVREYVERTWPNQFLFVDPAYAIECELFGPGAAHPRLEERLGDLLLIARGRSYLWWSPKEDHLLGRHGGFSEDEMLVPFVAAEL